jgi:hypothetical protein
MADTHEPNKIMTPEDLDRAYPVGQSTQTGKFGWRRCNGSLNLNSCSFANEQEAWQDRDAANRADDLGSR